MPEAPGAGPPPALLTGRRPEKHWRTAGYVVEDEAFADVVVQSLKDLELDMNRCNPNGGAIALGHPLGASGARVLVTAVHELIRRGGGTAAVALCSAGGQGQAMVISRY